VITGRAIGMAMPRGIEPGELAAGASRSSKAAAARLVCLVGFPRRTSSRASPADRYFVVGADLFLSKQLSGRIRWGRERSDPAPVVTYRHNPGG
jgi:hypothetical protein